MPCEDEKAKLEDSTNNLQTSLVLATSTRSTLKGESETFQKEALAESFERFSTVLQNFEKYGRCVIQVVNTKIKED